MSLRQRNKRRNQHDDSSSELEFISVDKELPKKDCRVLVFATNKQYQFGQPQLIAGYFTCKYYDTPINRFTLLGAKSEQWKVLEWSSINHLIPLRSFSNVPIG